MIEPYQPLRLEEESGCHELGDWAVVLLAVTEYGPEIHDLRRDRSCRRKNLHRSSTAFPEGGA